MHNEKYLKNKPESYNSKSNTYFKANKILCVAFNNNNLF